LWPRNPTPEARRRQFEELAREHEPALLRAALRLTGDPAEAEDLCQEALIKAYVAFEQFTRGSNFRAWTLRILANTHISRYRSNRRTPDTISWEDLGAASCRGEFDPPGDELGPEDFFVEHELSEDLAPALEALPEEFRLAVILSDILEMSYKEISTTLGVPLGTVRSRIFRGRKMLRESLQEYAEARRLV
jgi:RNA polymerase sigma-70 factor (ECF subfamily)